MLKEYDNEPGKPVLLSVSYTYRESILDEITVRAALRVLRCINRYMADNRVLAKL